MRVKTLTAVMFRCCFPTPPWPALALQRTQPRYRLSCPSLYVVTTLLHVGQSPLLSLQERFTPCPLAEVNQLTCWPARVMSWAVLLKAGPFSNVRVPEPYRPAMPVKQWLQGVRQRWYVNMLGRGLISSVRQPKPYRPAMPGGGGWACQAGADISMSGRGGPLATAGGLSHTGLQCLEGEQKRVRPGVCQYVRNRVRQKGGTSVYQAGAHQQRQTARAMQACNAWRGGAAACQAKGCQAGG